MITANRPDTSYRWQKLINDLTWEFETFSVLHYGSGEGNLARAMTKMAVKNYEPSSDEPPAPEDIVICTNVLEYVPEDELDEVLLDLKRVTNITLVVNIQLGYAPEMETQESIEWWLERLGKHFELHSLDGRNGREVTFILFKRVEH